ncbi:MAG: hypothetical protein K0S79_489 [Nitrospira sp.]|nr:hypothetical protein [Nitrospira sp.]MDF2458073.1 hypothetical protein [Nitrospira sp.]
MCDCATVEQIAWRQKRQSFLWSKTNHTVQTTPTLPTLLFSGPLLFV